MYLAVIVLASQIQNQRISLQYPCVHKRLSLLNTHPFLRVSKQGPCLVIYLEETIIWCILISLKEVQNLFHTRIVRQSLHAHNCCSAVRRDGAGAGSCWKEPDAAWRTRRAGVISSVVHEQLGSSWVIGGRRLQTPGIQKQGRLVERRSFRRNNSSRCRERVGWRRQTW